MIVEKKFKTKEVVITKEVNFPTYTINLSEYDAALLWMILGYCTSSPLTKVFYSLDKEIGYKVNKENPPLVTTIFTNQLTEYLDKLNLSKGV